MKCKCNQLLVLRVLESLWLCSDRENWRKLRETSRDSSSLAPTCRFLSNSHESDVHYTTSSRENNVMDVYSGHVIFQHMVCILEVMRSIQGNVYSSSCLGCSSDHNFGYPVSPYRDFIVLAVDMLDSGILNQKRYIRGLLSQFSGTKRRPVRWPMQFAHSNLSTNLPAHE